MTSYIGDITLTYFNVYSRSHRDITLAGFFETATERNRLAEMCSTSHNAVILPILGGGIIGQDNSINKLLITYCQFDEDQYFDGYYIILSWNYSPEAGWPNHYPWSLSMSYLGSGATLYEGFDIGVLLDVTNDWEP
jgi:hypothetical protein